MAPRSSVRTLTERAAVAAEGGADGVADEGVDGAGLAGAPVGQVAAWLTWKAPSTQMSRWPPRIMAKLSVWWKYAPPGSSVTGCLPALMRS
jgi:hypothetical protein